MDADALRDEPRGANANRAALYDPIFTLKVYAPE